MYSKNFLSLSMQKKKKKKKSISIWVGLKSSQKYDIQNKGCGAVMQNNLYDWLMLLFILKLGYGKPTFSKVQPNSKRAGLWKSQSGIQVGKLTIFKIDLR